MRGIFRVCTVVGLALMVAGPAQGRAKEAKAEGIKPLTHIKPKRGFVDDAMALDGAGGRLAVVTSDAASFSEVEVFDLNQRGASLARFDISKATTYPTEIAFVLDGSKIFVKSKPEDKEATAFVVDFSGKVLRKWGPATDIALTERDGAQVAVVFEAEGKKDGTQYTVSAYRLDNGRRVGKKRTFKADGDGYIKSIDMSLLYWQDGYLGLVGKKRGDYDRFKDRRMPDSQGTYDVLDGQLIRTTVPEDMVEYLGIVKLRVERNNEPAFVVVGPERRQLQLITPDDERKSLELAEPFYKYEPASLQTHWASDGKLYFTMTVDPVNPDAVARKKADPVHIDLYVLDKGQTKARRLARLPKGSVDVAWQVEGGRWAVLHKHKGFSRGGTLLQVFEITSK